jgi:hypothetical protein
MSQRGVNSNNIGIRLLPDQRSFLLVVQFLGKRDWRRDYKKHKSGLSYQEMVTTPKMLKVVDAILENRVYYHEDKKWLNNLGDRLYLGKWQTIYSSDIMYTADI